MNTRTQEHPVSMLEATATQAPPRLLIVATDWDKERRGLSYAIERRRRTPSLRVDVLYATAPIIAWQVLRFWAYGRVISWQREQGERLLETYHRCLAKEGIDATYHLRLDDPAKAIPRLAVEIGAECVVLPAPPSTELAPFGYWWDLHRLIRQSGTAVVLA